MKIEYRIYENTDAQAPASKRFFCLPNFLLDGKMQMTFFTYGATEREAREKAEEFWNAEIAKARANRGKAGKGDEGKGRPQTTAVTPEMLAKIDDDFDPKG